MKVPFVDLAVQYEVIREEVDAAMATVFQASIFVGGKPLADFEAAFAEYHDTSYTVSCASGTDALEIALEALGIGPDDEVLVPAYTWVSDANAVARLGARPVFVDLHPDFYTMDVSSLEAKITPKTKAILPVHFYGIPADMPAIMEIARAHELKVVEDCAQAHGASIDGKKVGTWGDVGAFSFYPTKNLGAYGDGGAMICNDKALADRMRLIAMQGQVSKNEQVGIGRNSRLDTLQAAILNVKLPHLDRWTAERNQIAQWYNELLDGLPIQLPVYPENYQHVFHLYVIQTEKRDALQTFLKDRGIQTQIHYPKPLTQLGIFEEDGKFPIAHAMSERILSLPMFPGLTQEQVTYVAVAIKDFFTK